MIFGDLSSCAALPLCCLLLGQGSGWDRASSPAASAGLGHTQREKCRVLALLGSVVISLRGSGLNNGWRSLLRSFPCLGSLARSLCKHSLAVGFVPYDFQVRSCWTNTGVCSLGHHLTFQTASEPAWGYTLLGTMSLCCGEGITIPLLLGLRGS